ncbi:glycoside hydrolase [Auriculariales sp. MPI-PUGE-AT-0066]|nr:glycoside hydrolase [Auriculariales sp. MPI-PUGE-AT-0066]
MFGTCCGSEPTVTTCGRPTHLSLRFLRPSRRVSAVGETTRGLDTSPAVRNDCIASKHTQMVCVRRVAVLATLAALCSAKPRCRLRRRGQLILNPPAPTSPASNSTTTTSVPPTATNVPDSGGDEDTALPPFNYSSNVIRGVNLGGWFVLEPWITPSMFSNTGIDAIIDEYTFGKLQDGDVALGQLTTHWESWYTEDEFKLIADAGINHVRIPLGYWSVPLDGRDVSPYIAGAYPYFKQALKWARKYKLYVILDLHGAPGSQNGYDNSGQKRNDPQWANDPNNLQWTVDVISFLANDVGDSIAVVQLLNEVAAYTSQQFLVATKQYWQDGYHAVRGAKAASNVQVMIGDGFQGVNAWQGFMQPPAFTGVSMDYHQYQVFSIPDLQRSWDDHIAHACSLGPNLAAFSKGTMPTVMGEWSLAITDCTKWLNGRGVGVRWDGTYYPNSETVTLGSCDELSMDYTKFSDDYKAFLRKYWEAQAHIGEEAAGWIFWAWKAEFSAEWSYRVGVEQGWIPQDPTDRLYPNICG